MGEQTSVVMPVVAQRVGLVAVRKGGGNRSLAGALGAAPSRSCTAVFGVETRTANLFITSGDTCAAGTYVVPALTAQLE